jgi:hypothetical protein
MSRHADPLFRLPRPRDRRGRAQRPDRPDKITGTLKNDQTFSTLPVEGDKDLLPKLLQDNNVQYSGKAQEEPNMLSGCSPSRCRSC